MADAWQEYREALTAATRVGRLQGEALDRAQEERRRAVDESRGRHSRQEQMFVRARAEADEVRAALTALYARLGVRPPAPGESSRPGAQTLAQVRGTLSELRAWTDEATTRHESLRRSLARLEAAEKQRPAAAPPVPAAPARRPGCALLALSLVVCLATVVLSAVLG